MIIYIEYVLIDNFIIDYLLFKATFFIVKIKVKKARLFLSSVLGALFSLVYPTLKLNPVIFMIVKVLFGFFLVLISAKFRGLKAYYFSCLIFFSLTFLSGGVITGILNLFNISNLSEYSLALMFLPVYFLLKSAVKLITYIYKRKSTVSLLYKTEIYFNGKTVKGVGFLDTGNIAFNGSSPIIVASLNFVKQLFKNKEDFLRLSKITLSTVSGESEKFFFFADKIKIYFGTSPNIYNNVTVAIVKNLSFEFDVILNSSFTGENSEGIYEQIDCKVKEVS